MAKKWIIPPAIPQGTDWIDVTLCVPDVPEWRALISGAIWELTRGRNWNEQTGNIRDTQAVARRIFESMAIGCMDGIKNELAWIRHALVGTNGVVKDDDGNEVRIDYRITAEGEIRSIRDALIKSAKNSSEDLDWGVMKGQIDTWIAEQSNAGRDIPAWISALIDVIQLLDELYNIIPSFKINVGLGEIVQAVGFLGTLFQRHQNDQVFLVGLERIAAAINGGSWTSFLKDLAETSLPMATELKALFSYDDQVLQTVESIESFFLQDNVVSRLQNIQTATNGVYWELGQTGLFENYVTASIDRLKDACAIDDEGLQQIISAIEAIKMIVNCGSGGGTTIGEGDITEPPPAFDPPPVDPPPPDEVPNGYPGDTGRWNLDKCHAANMLAIGIHNFFAETGEMEAYTGIETLSQVAVLAQFSHWQALANLHVGPIQLSLNGNRKKYAGFILNRAPNYSVAMVAGIIGSMPLSSGYIITYAFASLAIELEKNIGDTVMELYEAEDVPTARDILEAWISGSISDVMWSPLQIIYQATIEEYTRQVVSALLTNNLLNVLFSYTSLVSSIETSPYPCGTEAGDLIQDWQGQSEADCVQDLKGFEVYFPLNKEPEIRFGVPIAGCFIDMKFSSYHYNDRTRLVMPVTTLGGRANRVRIRGTSIPLYGDRSRELSLILKGHKDGIFSAEYTQEFPIVRLDYPAYEPLEFEADTSEWLDTEYYSLELSTPAGGKVTDFYLQRVDWYLD